MADITDGLKGLSFSDVLAESDHRVGKLDALREGRELAALDEPRRRFRDLFKDNEDSAFLLEQMIRWRPTRNQQMLSQYDDFLRSDPSEDIGSWAHQQGYGEDWKYDRRMANPAQLNDIEDSRARLQPTWQKYVNSLNGAGATAAAVAADSWIGLPAGVISLAEGIADGSVTNFREGLNAVVDNPVSNWLNTINTKFNEETRNYATAEERNRPWWQNMFTANFIGDTLLRNMGFTVGAAIGGRAAVGALGKITGADKARDVFKGLTAELGLNNKSASEVLKLLREGSTQIEKKAAIDALTKSAATLRSAERGLKLAGGLIAGSGEARIEALNGVDEYDQKIQDMYGNLDMQRVEALAAVQQDMIKKGIDINTPEGQAYYETEKNRIDDKYIELQEQIAHDKITVGNTIFAANIPLLTFDDMVQWGKMMLGGYHIDRRLVNGIKRTSEEAAKRAGKQSAKELIGSTRYALKGSKFTEALDKGLAASRNVLTEMQEEMNQSFISATAKAKAMGSTTEFMERLYDPMAVYDTVTWMNAAKQGMQESWLNKDDWVEGFAGGFMGFLGLPSVSVRVDENTGKKKPKITMEGGIWSPLRETKDLWNRRRELVQTINDRLSDPKFLNYYYGKIGNQHFESIKQDALAEGDKHKYDTADHAQFVNDAITFAQAGRLQDFIDIIDSFENVSDSDLAEIRELHKNSDVIKAFTNESYRTLISDNVKKAKERIDEFIKVSDDLRVVYGNTIDDNFINEMTWQTVHLDEIEKGLKQIVNEPGLSSLLSQYKTEQPDSIKELTDYELASSDGFIDWLKNKEKDTSDTTDKKVVKDALTSANDAKFYMSERLKYINNIAQLSQDPDMIRKMREDRQRAQDLAKKRLTAIANLLKLQNTSKLSDVFEAVDELFEDPDTLDKNTLDNMRAMANDGNTAIKEFLEIYNNNKAIKEEIDKANVSDAIKEQARAAWEYIKRNSNTGEEAIGKHTEKDVAPEIAGKEAIAVLNAAVEKVAKDNELYKRIPKRTYAKPEQTAEDSGTEDTEPATVFRTTGNKLTKEKFAEIKNNLSKVSMSAFGNVYKLDLGAGNVYYNGNPAHGTIWVWFKDGKGNNMIGYDSRGNEIHQDELKLLTGPDGKLPLYKYMFSDGFNANAYRSYNPVLKKILSELPFPGTKQAGKKSTGVTGDGGNSSGKSRQGTKGNPHKYLEPDSNLSVLGADSTAVKDAIKNLKVGSKVSFGLESADGPIFILSGPKNEKVGTLPRQDGNQDVYSGLAELDNLIREEYKSVGGAKNANGMWVSEQYSSTVREKHTAGFETTDQNVPLSEIPGFNNKAKPVVMLVTSKGVFRSDGKQGVDDILYSTADYTTKDVSDRFKPGYLYLLVPGESGRYFPITLVTQNVNADTLDLNDPAVIARGFGKRISDTIDKIADALNRGDAEAFVEWCYASDKSNPNSLQRLLYFRDAGNRFVQMYSRNQDNKGKVKEWFRDQPDVVMVLNVHDEESDTDNPIFIKKGQPESIREQLINAIMSIEFETDRGESHGPIAQISSKLFDDNGKPVAEFDERLQELLDSNMLLTNVRDFNLTVPSFTMDYWSVADGKFVKPGQSPAQERAQKKPSPKKVVKSKDGKKTICTVSIGGHDVQVDLSKVNRLDGEAYKIGKGKWVSAMELEKQAKGAKIPGTELSTRDFLMIAKALAVIADRYGDDTTGVNRIGDKVLLPRFSGNKTVGFVITDDGGRFMTPQELSDFKIELKRNETKPEVPEAVPIKDEEKKEEVTEEDIEEDEDDDSPFSLEERVRFDKENERIEKVKDVKEAIQLLRKKAPQYKDILDKLSKSPYYDKMLVHLCSIIDPQHLGYVGLYSKKKLKSENSYTARILLSDRAFGYRTLMHEIVHAYTSVVIGYDSGLRGNIRTIMDYIQTSIPHHVLVEALGTNGMYAFANEKEFVAEFFSNEKLQELTKKMDAPGLVELEALGKTHPGTVYDKIVDIIADLFAKLFGTGKSLKLFDVTRKLLYDVIDRQVELQELKELYFQNEEEFYKARKLSNSMRLTIPYDENRNPVRPSNELPEGMRRIPNGDMVDVWDIVQNGALLFPDDFRFKLTQILSLLNQDGIYEFKLNGRFSSILGIRQNDVFVGLIGSPVLRDNDFAQLLDRMAHAPWPAVIAADKDTLPYYKKNGFRQIHMNPVGGKILVANAAFNVYNFMKLAQSHKVFADAIDSNPDFVNARRMSYTDTEWNRMSDEEKKQARECIGI